MKNFLCFSRIRDYPVVMITEVSSYLVVVTDGGLERFGTVNPQPGVDYDESGKQVKIIGVDII